MSEIEVALGLPHVMDVELISAEERQRHLRPRRFPLPRSTAPEYPWPAPTEKDLNSEDFNLVWEEIKGWDINVSQVYGGYCSATGNHVMALLFALGLRNIQDYTPGLKRNQGEKK